MNTERDWLYVEDWWTVYGVIDPLSKCVCYVGITNGPLSKRFSQQRHLNELIDNYEPPDPPGWEGGFAENH